MILIAYMTCISSSSHDMHVSSSSYDIHVSSCGHRRACPSRVIRKLSRHRDHWCRHPTTSYKPGWSIINTLYKLTLHPRRGETSAGTIFLLRQLRRVGSALLPTLNPSTHSSAAHPSPGPSMTLPVFSAVTYDRDLAMTVT